MELQRLSLLMNLNRPPSQIKSARKPDVSNSSAKRSSQTGEGQPQNEVLISVSNTVASSSGIDLSDSRLAFTVDEDTGDTVINIIDNSTGDVIRQIPPDEVLQLKKSVGALQGLLVDKKI